MYAAVKIRKALFWVMVVVIAMVALITILAYLLLIEPTQGTPEQGIRLPIVMYHSLLNEEKRQGKYVVDPDQFERDLEYLLEQGYETITVQDLLDYVHGVKDLPQKPIMITFDDGYYNNYHYAYPILKKYQCKAVISPVGSYSDEYSQSGEVSPNYSYLTWDHIKEMADSGWVEFQNHSYDLHSTSGARKGIQQKDGESEEAYRQVLSEDLLLMQEKLTEAIGNYTPTAFVYPFGAQSESSLPILKELGFQCTLTCVSKMNVITKDPDSLFELGRYLRPSGSSAEEFFTKILE